jgi:hypothetical protein
MPPTDVLWRFFQAGHFRDGSALDIDRDATTGAPRRKPCIVSKAS